MRGITKKNNELIKQILGASKSTSIVMSAEQENYNFHYISAGAGSGKTEWAINQCKHFNTRGNNVVIVVPTIVLAESFKNRSKGLIVPIHSDNTETNVVSSITDTFIQQAKSGAIPISIVITEQAFALTDFKLKNDNWILIKDEATDPLVVQSIQCTDSKYLINEWFDFTKITDINFDTKLSRVNFTSQCPQTTDDKDDVLKEIYKLKSLLENPFVEILADTEKLQWEKPELRYSIFAKPGLYSGFKECYFMAANFEHTFLYHIYKNRKVKWINYPINTRPAIDSTRVRFHYWSEDNAWSKNFREKSSSGTGKSNLKKFLDWFESQEPGTDYVYCSNKSDNVTLPGTKMPAVCHGLNDWQDFTKFMSTASYLISNGDESFYHYYGLTSSDGRALRSVQMLYQQIMRTNLRDSSSQKKIDIYLPTFTEVRDLMQYFPKAVIQDCEKTKPGAKTGIEGTLQANWKCNYHEAHEVITATSIVMGGHTYAKEPINISYSEMPKSVESNICTWDGENNCFYSHIPKSNQPVQGKENIDEVSFAENEIGDKPYSSPQKTPIIKNNTPKKGRPPNGSELIHCIASINNDISLSGLSKDEIKSAKRSKLRLFVTGQFHDGSSFKREDCFGNINLLAFDFDNTDLTDKQIKQTFLTCELLIYTTPSHDPAADLRRIRVVVLCDRAMTLNEHSQLMAHYQSIFQKLSNQHGLDKTKLTPWSKFYMPHAESIKTHITRNKKPLNVDAILAKIPRKPIINAPEISDFDFKKPNPIRTFLPIDTGKLQSINSNKQKCLELIDQMSPGNRSNLAVTVAGKAQYLSNEDKQELYYLIEGRGVDSSALKQFRKYSGMT